MPEEYKIISKENPNKIIPYKDTNGNQQYALNGNRISFLKQSLKDVFIGANIENDIANLLCDFWYDIDFNNTQNQGGVSFTSAKKPEQLLYRIIDMTTNKNDLVLDFFAGSVTTLAVAHKMQRRYIGIEQMDYIQNITKQRLAKVINGEQGGISKSINWQGGGSFLYLELAELNAKFKQQIQQATTFNDLKMLGKELDKSAFLNYKIDKKTICQIIEEDKFKKLNFAQQQQMLIACLDANMDYIPFAEIDDENYHFSETDKQLNNAFYKISN